MDAVKAAQLERELAGKVVGEWTVGKLINHGKSAAVFRAHKEDTTIALKIFDDELIEKYGDAVQIKRIERELTLQGVSHPNMVRILGGGIDKHSKNHFIAMELLNGPNLKDCLQHIPYSNIPSLIAQLASCGKFLEDLGHSHRDIKPENIVVLDDYKKFVLLDFGVLRPIGQPGLTDGDGIHPFVGTLQYSSPEFLLRNEEDTAEGWRALSVYQIGAVLHDLIMKRPIFWDKAEPYARLVNAVQFDTPDIQNPTVPRYLVELAQSALVKDPKVRVQLVNWDSFAQPPQGSPSAKSARNRVTQRAKLLGAAAPPPPHPSSQTDEILEATIQALKVQVRSIRAGDSATLPPVVVSRSGPALFVRFRPGTQQGLPLGIALKITTKVLDAASGAIELHAAAFIGGSATSLSKLGGVFFRGLFSPGSAATALEDCIYLSVDKAQQSPTESAGAEIPLFELEEELA